MTFDEALETGLKFLGDNYQEVGVKGSGVYKSADGLKQFRIDVNSLAGKHSPYTAHCHLEIIDQVTQESILNNHITLLE